MQANEQKSAFLIAQDVVTASLRLAVKDSSVNKYLVLFGQTVNLFQMLRFPVKSITVEYVGSSPLSSILAVADALSIIALPGALQTVLFVLSLVWASCVVCLGISVGYKHTFQKRLHTMELKIWRTVAYMSASFLFLPVMSAFVGYIGCDTLHDSDSDAAWLGTDCWQGAHLGWSLAACFVASQYTVLAILAAALFVDRSTATDAWHAKSDGRFDAQFLLMKIVLVLLYGVVDPNSLPSWLVVGILLVVGVVWVRQFVLKQPHASMFINVLRGAYGAVFSWGVLCLAITSIWTSVDVTFPFIAGAVLLFVVVRFLIVTRRSKLMQRQPFGMHESDLLLWCRLRLILAHRITSNAADLEETVWYGGGSLLMTALKTSHSDGQHMQQRVAASRALRSLLHVYKTADSKHDADSDPGFAGVVSPGPEQEAPAHLGNSVTISNNRNQEPGTPAPGVATSMGQYLQARHMMHNSAANRTKSVPSTIDMHKDDQQSDDDQVVVYGNSGASPRKVVSENLVQLVYKELQAQNDQNKLSPMLLQLLADIQRHFLLNSFMELMALSQARHHPALPWDVSFWVEQRLEVLRGKQETASGDTELSPVERLLFDQHFQWAIKHQTQWYKDIVAMWTELRQKSPDLGELQHIAEHLAKALTETEHCFKAMMKISRNSAKAMHAYGAFLIRIRHSENEGMALVQRAERLEQAALNQAQREIAHFRMSELCHEHLVMDETAAVIVTSGEPARLGEITTCNAVAASMFKRPKSQIVGQNVNILVPPPIAGVHEHFLRKYSRTGEGRLMNRTRHLLSIDSTGSLLPARCTLRESPPLEGSSFPQITMLMQPLRVAENFIIFGDSGQGYQVFCGDHESYQLLGVSYRQLQESAVSMVQFFPEVDLSFAATWDEQQREEAADLTGVDDTGSVIPEEDDNGSPSVSMGVCPMGYTSADAAAGAQDSKAATVHVPHFDMPAGHHQPAPQQANAARPELYLRIGGGPNSRPASAPRSARGARPLLGAMKGFRKTPVRSLSGRGATSVLASVQKMRIPHCGIIYLLTWKKMTAQHAAKGAPASNKARRLIRRMSNRSSTSAAHWKRASDHALQSKHAPVRRAHTLDSHAHSIPQAPAGRPQGRSDTPGQNPSDGIASPPHGHRVGAPIPSVNSSAEEPAHSHMLPSKPSHGTMDVVTLRGAARGMQYTPAPDSKENSSGTAGTSSSEHTAAEQQAHTTVVQTLSDGEAVAVETVPGPVSNNRSLQSSPLPRNNSTPAPERGVTTPHPDTVQAVSPVANAAADSQPRDGISVITSEHATPAAPSASRNWSWSGGQQEAQPRSSGKPKRHPGRFNSRWLRSSMLDEGLPPASQPRTSSFNARGPSESVFDGAESHAAGSSYTSAVARYSKLTQHVLDAATTQDHHPSVQYIKLVFVVQFLLLVAGSVVVMVYRNRQVSGLELFVDAIQHGTELEQHAQTSLTLMSSIMLMNQGLRFADKDAILGALDAEVSAFSLSTALALDETAQLGSNYDVHFASDVISIPNGDRVSLRFTPSESASWLASKMHVVASLPVEQITFDQTTVAEVLRVSPVLLQDVFPGLITELKQEFVSYAADRERASEIGILVALCILVPLIGAIAMFFISKLAAHRRVVLRAVASVPLRVVRQLSKNAIMGAKQHLSQLSRGDNTGGGDTASEGQNTPRMSDLDGEDVQPFQDMLDTMQSPVHLEARNAVGRNVSDMQQVPENMTVSPDQYSRGFSMDANEDVQIGAPKPFSAHKVVPSSQLSATDSKHTHSAPMVDTAPPAQGPTLTFAHDTLEHSKQRSQLRTTASEAARHKPHDSSCFEAAALAKLMMPTAFVFIMVIVLWLDVGTTNATLMKQAYRVFSARDVARHSAASLQVTLMGLNDLPINGTVPGLGPKTQRLAEAAVAASTALLRGVAKDDLAGGAVEGLDSTSREFELLTENSCVAGNNLFTVAQCEGVDSGIFTRGGLQSGLLRFASDVVDLASSAQDGSVAARANKTRLAASIGDKAAYNALVFAPGSENLNVTRNLQQLAYPYIIGMCNTLAQRLDTDLRSSSTSAADRSQALVVAFLCVLLLASVLWVMPTARRIGRRVYATHALVAAVPPEMQARLPAFRKVLKRIANIQTQHSDSSINDINTLFTVLDDADGSEMVDIEGHQPSSRR